MSAQNPLTRRLPDGADCRYRLSAGVVLVLAAVAVVYGVANDDTVTDRDGGLVDEGDMDTDGDEELPAVARKIRSYYVWPMVSVRGGVTVSL